MNIDTERNLGRQPIASLMEQHNVSAHDLVGASTKQMTHKMVARAVKGRRLTKNTQRTVLDALNNATHMNYSLNDLFNY